MNDIKEGKFGRPKEGKFGRPNELPKIVKQMVDDVTKGDIDWQQGTVDGDLWLVCKIWDDDQSFNILASKVIFESDMIELKK